MCSGVNDFKRVYQTRSNIIKDEKGDLFTDYHSILAKWRDHFCQILNEHGFTDVRQNTAQKEVTLVTKPSAFEVEMTIEKLKRYK